LAAAVMLTVVGADLLQPVLPILVVAEAQVLTALAVLLPEQVVLVL
jgi:hypothetical protein